MKVVPEVFVGLTIAQLDEKIRKYGNSGRSTLELINIRMIMLRLKLPLSTRFMD